MKLKFLFAVFLLRLFVANAHVWVNDEVIDDAAPGYVRAPVYPSIAYFTFRETEWYLEVDLCLNGYLHLYSSPFMAPSNTTTDSIDARDLRNFLLVNLGDVPLDMDNVRQAADILRAEIIILVLNHRTWKERLSFWWSHKLPQSSSHLEASTRYYLVAVTPDTGKSKSLFYHQMLLVHHL